MDHTSQSRIFCQLLTAELENGLREIAAIKWEKHTGFIVYCADLTNMGWAANSQEQIEHSNCHYYLAERWDRTGGFEGIEEFLDSWYENWLDCEDDQVPEWDSMVIDCVTKSILSLQKLSIHKQENFSSDFLWGIYFSDPLQQQIDTMLTVSELVNSQAIHAELVNATQKPS